MVLTNDPLNVAVRLRTKFGWNILNIVELL